MQDKTGAVLIIGAGVGGIKTALDLAESGHRVYLSDRNPWIGGALLQLEKWYPDNKCELCKLLPVFNRDECSQFCLRRDLMHPNIEVIPNARIVKLTGEAGNFTATLNIQSKGVSGERCTACGLCATVCPVEVEDEFEHNLRKRKAIYVQTPQSVPNVYSIDHEFCTKCTKCMEICPTKVIALDMLDESRALSIGAIVLAAGSTELPAGKMGQYGYGYYSNVLTNIQLERMLADTGPTGGKLARPSDGKKPKKIAILQCVGSRDKEHGYCSESCCMYALKEGIMVRDKFPDTEVTIFYMDIRAFGKDYYRYHLLAKNKGVKFARSRVSRIRENPKTNDLFLLACDESGKSISAEYELAVLSVGQCASRELSELSTILNVVSNKWGFIDTSGLYLARTSRPGIFVTGSASGPSDIAETIIKSGAAALEASTLLNRAGNQTVRTKTIRVTANTEEPPQIAVFICKCGSEVSSVVDIEKIKEFAASLPGVIHVEEGDFLCLPETLDKLQRAIRQTGVNRVVMAACSPYRYHRLFGDALKQAGIGSMMWQLINFREQLAWVHKGEEFRERVICKAQNLLSGAVERLRLQEPLEATVTEVKQSCLIIGGGISGCVSAISLANLGYEITLVEKTGELGGHSRTLHYDLASVAPPSVIKDIDEKVKNHPNIRLMRNAEVEQSRGNAGRFVSLVRNKIGEIQDVRHGAIIVATGATDYTPTEYLYGKDKRVITQHEFQRRIAENNLDNVSSIVMVQCVGSRDANHQYCSRTCCTEAICSALKIKEINPHLQVFILNRDIMAYGFKELDYLRAREEGVLFHRYEPENPPQVATHDKCLTVEWHDPALPGKLCIECDLLVLSTGYIAQGNEKLAEMLGLEITKDGFFREVDSKFRPVDATKDGIFITGLANGPQSFAEKITEAQAAAQRAANILSRPKITSSLFISEVDARRCTGCSLCVEACPFDARSLDNDEHYAVVDDILCQGCGMCVAACMNDAAGMKGQKDKTVLALIDNGI